MSATEPNLEELNKKRNKIIAELKSTEVTYLQNIKRLYDFFFPAPPEDKDVVRFKKIPAGGAFIAEIEKIKPIKDLSESLMLKFNDSHRTVDSDRISQIFLEELNFDDYNQYLESYPKILALLKENNKDFKALMDQFMLANDLTLESFLIMPVQRLPRYVLLLKELKKAEENLKKDVSILDKSISRVQEAALACNAAIGKQADLAEWTKAANLDYDTPENRGLRSVQKQPGDISRVFNKDEDLEKLKEELEKNEALKGLLKNQKITLTYDQDLLGHKKTPLTIRCMLNGRPLCKIVQETGKNGEENFYVRIKTKLKTLDHDAIKAQLDMAKAVSDVVVNMVENLPRTDSPFEGYTKVVDEAAGKDGAQAKGMASGEYIGPDGKRYYIKRAESENVDDDIAELLASRFNALSMGKERAVQYKAVRNTQDKTMYVASEITPGFKTIKKVVKLPIPVSGADLLLDANKDAVYAALTPEQRKEMARVLAGSLWVRDIDSQYGNILLNIEKEDGTIPRQNSEGLDTVKKFDNGWGLSKICKPKHAQVILFEKHSLIHKESVGTHGHTKIPTNHFNDYPKIIRSQDFVKALADTVQELTDKKIEAVVRRSMDEIKEAYEENGDYWKTLESFAQHMDLNITTYEISPRELPTNTDELAEYISKKLSTRLKERAFSMALLQRMLAIDLALKARNIQEVGRLATELQYVVYEKYKDKKGKAMLLKDILPPYNPPFEQLMASVTELMKKDLKKKLSLTKDERDAISFCTDLSKESNAKKTLAQKAPWFQKEKEEVGWKPPEPEPAALKPEDLQHRLLAAEHELQHDPNSGDNPKVTPLVLPIVHESSKTHVTTAKDQTPETFSKYCDCLMKQLGTNSVPVSKSENSRVIGVTSESEMLAGSKPGTGAGRHLIIVTHLEDNSIRTTFPSISDEWKKIFLKALDANIEAGLTRLSPNGSFEQVQYMTKEILKKNLTPVFSPETKKLLEAHKDGGSDVAFLEKMKAEIEAEKSLGQPSPHSHL